MLREGYSVNMRAFMDDDFLLYSETAKHLYNDYAKDLPIIDYHCHLSPKEIYEDLRFDSLTQVWLGGKQSGGTYAGDHYKWRLMRANGMPEDKVTGGADEYERFVSFVDTLNMAVGNPMYHWCHLELKRYFGIDKPLNRSNMKEVWDKCNDMLHNDPGMTVRGLIKKSNVEFIGTTDDPTDSLEWHEKIAKDESVTFTVRPSFRPDKAVNIHKPGFAEYIYKLAAAADKNHIDTIKDVIDALIKRLDYFVAHGCVASDHGLDYVPYNKLDDRALNAAFKKAMRGESLTAEEIEGYETAVLTELAKAYHKRGIVMEIHYSCLRNSNERMLKTLGPDTGYDVIAQNNCGSALAAFLSNLDATDELPKTVIFSLDPTDNVLIDTIIGSFQSPEIPGKLQHGPAWWFNDTKLGMEAQMKSLAEQSLLGNFIGMLTDSRSFLSYTRHEYFRRILCNLIGTWVENGEYPNDDKALKQIVEGISYRNAVRYFGIG